MTVTKVGHSVSEAHEDEYEEESLLDEFGELSGAEYSIRAHKDAAREDVLIETSHDAVGLVTFWRANSYEEAEAWVYKMRDEDDFVEAEQSYAQLMLAINGEREAIGDAIIAGLIAIAGEDRRTTETIETVLAPVVKVLKEHGIPSPGGGEETDAWKFWRGVAEAAP
jgi:hypothetical protein